MSELLKIAAKERPSRNRSRLDPYLLDMIKLKSEGYSFEQLRIFLAELGVSVSRQTIQEYLVRRGPPSPK